MARISQDLNIFAPIVNRVRLEAGCVSPSYNWRKSVDSWILAVYAVALLHAATSRVQILAGACTKLDFFLSS